MKIIALSLFVLTYLLLLILPKFRAAIAVGSAIFFVLLGILPPYKIAAAIDFNVILMIAGTMGTVSLFIASKMPALLADLIIEKTPNVKWTIISLSLFSGLISAFIDNVATVLIVAPVAITIAKRLKISPVGSIIAIAIASNLQGAATLVGDTTSILLGGHADLDFLDFFIFRGKAGLFWIVQLSAAASTLVLMYIFRKENKSVAPIGRIKVEDYFPTILLAGTVAFLILASFIPNKPAITNGVICVSLMVVGVVRDYIKTKKLDSLKTTLMEIDYFTLILLGGLFIVIGGIVEVGIVEDISWLFIKLSNNNVFLVYSLLVWVSVLFSAFIDNIPYVATMLPVVTGIAQILCIDPYLLYFGLLSGATLGGNLTPIGASANITALGILRKEGYNVETKEFMKISVPFTLAAVITGYVLVWFIWGP